MSTGDRPNRDLQPRGLLAICPLMDSLSWVDLNTAAKAAGRGLATMDRLKLEMEVQNLTFTELHNRTGIPRTTLKHEFNSGEMDVVRMFIIAETLGFKLELTR